MKFCFTTYCYRKYDEVDACMKTVRCVDTIEKAFEGLDNAMEFMCEEDPNGTYPWQHVHL